MQPSDLDQLMEAASAAGPGVRIEFCDPIAAHGSLAIPRLCSWLSDARLSAFAVRTLEKIAADGPNRRGDGSLRLNGAPQTAWPLPGQAGTGSSHPSMGISPHSLRHTFARSYLVNGGDVFSLQRILGHTTLDMVKRYVALAELEIVRRLHAIASPADRLLIGPRVSVILPQAVYRRLTEVATEMRVTVEALVRDAAEGLLVRPHFVSLTPATRAADHERGALIAIRADSRSGIDACPLTAWSWLG